MFAIKAGEVRPGKCFVGRSDGRVRRVISVRDGVVLYELRRGKPRRQTWELGAEAAMEAFVADLAKEVGSDYLA